MKKMKKKVLVCLLSLALTVSSIGSIAVFAETVATNAEQTIASEQGLPDGNLEIFGEEDNAEANQNVEEFSEGRIGDEEGEVVANTDEEEGLEGRADTTLDEEGSDGNIEVEEQNAEADKVELEEVPSDDGAEKASMEDNASYETEEPIENNVIEEETETSEENEAVHAGEVKVSGKCGLNATWTLTGVDDNLTLTISGSGRMADYLNYYIVPPWTSYSSQIKTIIIEDGITYIGEFAFKLLKMTNSVTIPESVLSIGNNAFSECDSLTSINIPNGVTSIGGEAFSGCDSLTSINIPNGVASIEQRTFSGCKNLTNIEIPNSVKSIGENAFDSCSRLTSIVISNGVERIEDSAFLKCSSLKSVEIPGSIASMGNCAFEGCSSLTNVTISDGAKMIGDGAFDGCNMKSITIPKSVTYVGISCFGHNNSVIVVYYKGTKEQWDEAAGRMNDFFVSRKSILFNYDFSENIDYEMSPTSFIYTGKEICPTVTLSCNGIVLKQSTDYTLSYKNNINTGNATIDITGIGDYSGTASLSFSILPGKTIRGDMFNLANNVKVTWKAVPGAKFYRVYREGLTDSDETISHPVIQTSGLVGWDKEPGLTNGHAYRYKIVASCSNSYVDDSGDSPLSYSKIMYRLKTVVIRSVKNTAAGKVTVKYDKTTSGDSYVLQYCERQDMVGAKTKVVLGANNTSYTIGGLKKGKTYYISIRVRKKVNGIDYYTTFGVPKKIKIVK